MPIRLQVHRCDAAAGARTSGALAAVRVARLRAGAAVLGTSPRLERRGRGRARAGAAPRPRPGLGPGRRRRAGYAGSRSAGRIRTIYKRLPKAPRTVLLCTEYCMAERTLFDFIRLVATYRELSTVSISIIAPPGRRASYPRSTLRYTPYYSTRHKFVTPLARAMPDVDVAGRGRGRAHVTTHRSATWRHYRLSSRRETRLARAGRAAARRCACIDVDYICIHGHGPAASACRCSR